MKEKERKSKKKVTQSEFREYGKIETKHQEAISYENAANQSEPAPGHRLNTMNENQTPTLKIGEFVEVVRLRCCSAQ